MSTAETLSSQTTVRQPEEYQRDLIIALRISNCDVFMIFEAHDSSHPWLLITCHRRICRLGALLAREPVTPTLAVVTRGDINRPDAVTSLNFVLRIGVHKQQIIILVSYDIHIGRYRARSV